MKITKKQLKAVIKEVVEESNLVQESITSDRTKITNDFLNKLIDESDYDIKGESQISKKDLVSKLTRSVETTAPFGEFIITVDLEEYIENWVDNDLKYVENNQ
jgi:hypothetical protein